MTEKASDTAADDTVDEPMSLRRRSVLSAVGTAGVVLAGVGAFTGTAAAWKRFEVDFRGCSEVWLVVDEEDLDFEKYDRDVPLFVNVVVETEAGAAACRAVEFTEETTTTIPGQYGTAPLVKFSAGRGEKVLAVIEYNHNDVAICYVENDHRCARTPNVADWRDADCYDDLLEPENPDPGRFNAPCREPK